MISLPSLSTFSFALSPPPPTRINQSQYISFEDPPPIQPIPMEMNELFMCSAANADTDEMLLPPPLLHIDSSSPWPPSCFHDTGLYLDSVLGSLSSLSSTTTVNNERSVIGQLFSGNGLIPLSSHFNHHHRPSHSTDPGFADRDVKFSRLDRRISPLGKNVRAPAGVPAIPRLGNCDSPNCRDESSRSLEGSSISELVPWKRKSIDRGKAKESSKFPEGGDDSVITTTKRSREDEEVNGGDDIGPAKQPKLANEAEEEGGGGRKKKKSKKGGGVDDVEPPKDYIHVRARRGQATDSHSLAERVRREKISERMKMLQDLVPSCSKVTGKAFMLDEIINYVQSLQRQVEFLSLKLASVNTSMRCDMNMRIISKDMFQSSNSNTIAAAQLSMFEPPLHEKMQEGTNFKYSADPPLSDSIPPLNGLDDRFLAPFRGEDLHSIVEMGLSGQTNPVGLSGHTNPLDFDGQGHMNNSMNMMGELKQ